MGATRFLVDGSYVTAKDNPNDVDAVIFLPEGFEEQVDAGNEAALELDEASKSWKMKVALVPSRTDPAARIVVVRALERGS